MIQSANRSQTRDKRGEPEDSRKSVTFYGHAPTAKEVSLVGTFNGWDPLATPMKRNSSGEWFVVLDLLPGDHEYQAVVDGRWRSGPVYAIPQVEGDQGAEIQSHEWSFKR